MTQAQKRNMCLMEDIIKYCCQHEIFIDITFYVNGHKYSSEKQPTAKVIKTGPYEYYDYGEADVTTIVEYNNPDTLTMTFEGPLYDDINRCESVITNETIIERVEAAVGEIGSLS